MGGGQLHPEELSQAGSASSADGAGDDALRSIRAEISNQLATLMKSFYGKGPIKARTYLEDHFVFAVLEGGLTRNEETLLGAGQATLVRDFRLRFEEVMADQITGAVERATGRRVLTYHSQVLFDPFHAIEIFVLDGPPRLGREKLG